MFSVKCSTNVAFFMQECGYYVHARLSLESRSKRTLEMIESQLSRTCRILASNRQKSPLFGAFLPAREALPKL